MHTITKQTYLGLLLFDNVQFIYELVLAQLELESLGAKFEVANSLRKFSLYGVDSDKIQILKRRLAYFKLVGDEYTDYFYITKKNRTKSVNQYLTHWIYPYKGKFHPQMIRALLNIIGLGKGDTVLDPFIGSGTTALEAQLLGINCIGIDISPLCVLQSKVKTKSISVLNEIIKQKPNFLKLFDEKTLDKEISRIENEEVRNFYLLAKLVALSDSVRRKKDFKKSFLKNLEMMIASVKDFVDISNQLNLELGNVDIKEGDARKLSLPSNSVDGIITSPPYSIALDYIANDFHALKALGFEPASLREKFIGVRGQGNSKLQLYDEDMVQALKEMHRVLKPNKFAVLVLGNATFRGKEIKTVEFVIKQAEEIGFTLVKNIEKIIFGLYNIMQKENILIFRKQS